MTRPTIGGAMRLVARATRSPRAAVNEIVHVASRLLVASMSVDRAKWVLDHVVALPPLNVSEATEMAEQLRTSGTCLTRALAIAARLPGASLVVAARRSSTSAFAAHAWVELGARRIEPAGENTLVNDFGLPLVRLGRVSTSARPLAW